MGRIKSGRSFLDSWRALLPVNLSHTEGAMTTQDRIQGRKIGIIGMARSGVAAALLAEANGGKPFVSDNAPATNLSDPIAKLKAKHIPFEVGGHTDELLSSDYLIVSPGVPPTIPILKKAVEKGIPIFSEIEFASWLCKGKIIAITGSNGKTTTTTLVGEICKAAGFDTFVCGNIGLPFAEVAHRATADSVVVLEVSSAQLEQISEFRPNIGVILNITPDHLDRYGSFEPYRRAKYRIAENMHGTDTLLMNRDDSGTIAEDIPTKAQKQFFTVSLDANCLAYVQNDYLYAKVRGAAQQIIHRKEIRIPGPHNLQNASAASAIAGLLGVKAEIIAKTLASFAGVEHRLEFVARVAGINFVNDSKATNVDSVFYALKSIDTPLYLIAGGRDKGAPYAPIIEAGRGKIKGIIAIGEAKQIISNELGSHFTVKFAGTLEEAVQLGFSLAHPGETVLLSPGCASFDMFENYEHRGRVFKTAVAGLKNGNATHTTVTHR
jgi:UDP-N-acetylmuramoylalanine--D-glutamate ligase